MAARNERCLAVLARGGFNGDDRQALMRPHMLNVDTFYGYWEQESASTDCKERRAFKSPVVAVVLEAVEIQLL